MPFKSVHVQNNGGVESIKEIKTAGNVLSTTV